MSKRKVRSDKKRDVRPTIPTKYKSLISTLSYITLKPEKDVIEFLVKYALQHVEVIDKLADFFQRDYMYGSTLYRANEGCPNIKEVTKEEGGKQRATTRLSQNDYGQLSQLAFSLDITPSWACYVLLRMALNSHDCIHTLIQEYVENNLEEVKLKKLNDAIKLLNENNDSSQEITLVEVISYIQYNFKKGKDSLADKLKHWIG